MKRSSSSNNARNLPVFASLKIAAGSYAQNLRMSANDFVDRFQTPFFKQSPKVWDSHLLWNRYLSQQLDAGSTWSIDYNWRYTWWQIKRLSPHRNHIIYIKATFVRKLFKKIEKIPGRFVLVSGDHDLPPSKAIKSAKCLDHSKLICWWAQNMDIEHPKARWLPIGFDFHTMTRDTDWGPTITPAKQELEFTSTPRLDFSQRKTATVVCFNDRSNSDRKACRAEIGSDKLDIPALPRSELLKIYGDFKFVASPAGVGYDCHRHWEALALGCMIIVKSNPLDRYFEAIPNIIIVNEWSEVTNDALNRWSKSYSLNIDKYLTNDYWLSLIEMSRNETRPNEDT